MSSARSYMRARHDRKDKRREQTQERLEDWQTLSPAEQLRLLDARLGKGVGAVKQRARLAAKMVASAKAKTEAKKAKKKTIKVSDK